MPSTSTNRLALLALIVLMQNICSAQEPQVLSPYSAYGLGDVAPNMFAEQRAMGGVSLGVAHSTRLNIDLPSSFANLSHATFGTGMRIQSVTEKIGEETFKRNAAQFLGIGIGMPIKRGSWGAGFGLTPVTDIGYELTSNSQIAGGVPVEYNYTGSGGLNKMFAGVSKRIFQEKDSLGNVIGKLNFGTQFNYNFGTIGSSRRALYPSSEGFYNTNSTANVIVRGGTFDLSTQYHKYLVVRDSVTIDGKRILKERKVELVAGAFYGTRRGIGARRSDLTTTYLLTTTGVELTQDTVAFIDRAQGSIKMPASFGLGLGINVNDRFSLALEYRIQAWSDLEVDVLGWELPQELGDRTSFAIGASWSPSSFNALNDNKYFWKQTVLHGGFRTYQDYLVVNGSQLDGYATSLGVTLPLFGFASASKFTFGTELGSRGDVENGGIEESYVEFFAGFTITPSFKFDPVWFRKRRIE